MTSKLVLKGFLFFVNLLKMISATSMSLKCLKVQKVFLFVNIQYMKDKK